MMEVKAIGRAKRPIFRKRLPDVRSISFAFANGFFMFFSLFKGASILMGHYGLFNLSLLAAREFIKTDGDGVIQIQRIQSFVLRDYQRRADF